MKIDIDNNAGFCFGVVKAIETAEKQLAEKNSLPCLGKIVHNDTELHRLEQKGLKSIRHHDLPKYAGRQVLIRAHGEPPETYYKAFKNGVALIEATCPIVLKLQQRIAKYNTKDKQIVIFGKSTHPETIGLNGQISNQGIIVESEEDIDKIDFSKDVVFFSQTTMDSDIFEALSARIKSKMSNNASFKSHNTVCKQMKNRKPALIRFVKKYDVVLFVAGKHSSNGRFLFDTAKLYQPETYMISSARDIQKSWLKDADSIGISGATSTPGWLLQEVAQHVKLLLA